MSKPASVNAGATSPAGPIYSALAEERSRREAAEVKCQTTEAPLVAYMTTDSPLERDMAFLTTYAARLRDGTSAGWEIPNTVACTLEDIAKRQRLRFQTTEAARDEAWGELDVYIVAEFKGGGIRGVYRSKEAAEAAICDIANYHDRYLSRSDFTVQAYRLEGDAAESKLQVAEAARDEALRNSISQDEYLRKELYVRQQLLGDAKDLKHPPTAELARLVRQCAEAAESRLSSLTQAHARLRTAAQGVLDRNGGPTDTPYGPFVFVARDDFDAMEAALKADDLACRGQSAEDSATVQLARLTQAQQRLIAEWHDREADILEGGYECSSAGTDEPLIAAELAGKLHGVRQCIADLAAVAETTEGKP